MKPAREHEAALRCGWDRQRALNYAVTLQRFYRYDEAIRQAQNVMQREPLDLDAMEVMVTNAYFAGRFQLTAQLLAEYRKRVPDQWVGDLAEIETEMQSIQPMIEQSFLTDDQIVAMQQSAWALMRTLKSGNRKITIKDFVGNDGQVFLSRTFRLPLTFEEAQALDDQLVRQLAEHDDWPLEKFITIFPRTGGGVSVTSDDWLNEARRHADCPEEIGLRTAVSRGYYAGYHRALEVSLLCPNPAARTG
jgi:hypothetical protein